jgi:hypothetical protein
MCKPNGNIRDFTAGVVSWEKGQLTTCSSGLKRPEGRYRHLSTMMQSREPLVFEEHSKCFAVWVGA